MAWCTGRAIALPTPSAFFYTTGTIMKSNREQTKPTAVGDTIEADGGGGEMIAVARAHRELIDMLARHVLAVVEQDANSRPRDSKEGHGGEHGSQNGKPQRADAPSRATKPRDGAGTNPE